jgi:outer membrane protein assembly factor BamE
MYKSLICVLMMVLLSSCSYFQVRKPIIEQGNVLTDENQSQLHSGMSRSQVIALMGNPVLINILTPHRVEYIYTYQDGNNPRLTKRITCIFENGVLQEIQR